MPITRSGLGSEPRRFHQIPGWRERPGGRRGCARLGVRVNLTREFMCPNKLIQKGETIRGHTHTYNNIHAHTLTMATHLPGEIAGASGSVIGEIQLRVPLEHYNDTHLVVSELLRVG